MERETEVTQLTDPATRPAHSTRGHVEVWDLIEDQRLGWAAENVVKHVCRY